METKLTLKLKESVILKAKKYARSRNVSLSKMIESYLDTITQEDDQRPKHSISTFVDSLSGVIHLPDEYDYKKSYRDHIEGKYQ